MTSDQIWGLAAALGSALVFGLAAVAQAHGVRRGAVPVHNLVRFVASSVRDPWTWAVLVAYLVGFVLHAVAIWWLPLYLAQATIALSLPVTALASRHVAERLDRDAWTAVGLVSVGLLLLAAGSGHAGSVVTDGSFALCLWVGVALLSVASVAGGRLGGGGLGTLAGLGYAGSAIAVRGVGTPIDGAIVLAALSVPAFGLVAFWLYSRGMRSSAVSTATAPMIVGQTFIPAVVGLALLGDTVRPGWGWSIAAGLLISTLGAVRLARSPAVLPAPPVTSAE